ncbi:MAG: RNA ligase family protein, partial [Candidatus Helarchaeota archaeon]
NLHVDYYKQNFGFEDIGYFIFDIMDLDRSEKERFLKFDEVEQLCKEFNLHLIPLLGYFDDMSTLNEKLHIISPVFEGTVVKSIDGRIRLKYRFDQKPELFGDKLPKKTKRRQSPEEIIIAHFFQGYEETELGLNRGISGEEMDQYQRRLDEMKQLLERDLSKKRDEAEKTINLLMEMIQKHGTFNDERLKAIQRILKKRIGSQIGKILKLIKKSEEFSDNCQVDGINQKS